MTIDGAMPMDTGCSSVTVAVAEIVLFCVYVAVTRTRVELCAAVMGDGAV